jgi:hypothetical protein
MAQWARHGRSRNTGWCSARLVDAELRCGCYAVRGPHIADAAQAASALQQGADFINIPNEKQFVNALRTQLLQSPDKD